MGTADGRLTQVIKEGNIEQIQKVISEQLNQRFAIAVALRLAIKYGKTDIVKALFRYGTVHDNYGYIIGIAARRGNLELVEFLVDNGVDVHYNGDIAMRNAVRYGYIEIIKYLAVHGAYVDRGSIHPITMASSNGNLEIVKCLIELGANIHARNELALKLAVTHGHLDITMLLVKHGADIHSSDNKLFSIATGDVHRFLLYTQKKQSMGERAS